MDTEYTILMSYLENLSYSAIKELPNFFLNPPYTGAYTHTDINANISQISPSLSGDNDENVIYLLKIPVTISAVMADDNSKIFKLQVTYSSVISVKNNIGDEQHRLDILKGKAMSDIVNTKIRLLIWNISSEFGFPPIMLSDFKQNATCDASTPNNAGIQTSCANQETEFFDECDDDDTENCSENPVVFGYDYIIKQIRSNDDDETQKINKFFKMWGMESFDYDKQLFFKFYYRFFNAIPYLTNILEDMIDSRSWNIILQWLAGNPKAKYQLVSGPNIGDIPELIFDYDEFKSRAISSLTFEEIKILMYALFYDTIELTLDKICRFDLNYEYCDKIARKRTLSFEEFCKLYNCDEESPAELQTIVRELYSKISEYNLKTFMFLPIIQQNA